jgi:selenide,water dikinase
LLVACDGRQAERILATIRAAGYPLASIIGSVVEGAPGIHVA